MKRVSCVHIPHEAFQQILSLLEDKRLDEQVGVVVLCNI